MGLMAAFGCGLIGFGPVGVLFFLVVARDPLQVILFTIRSVPIPPVTPQLISNKMRLLAVCKYHAYFSFQCIFLVGWTASRIGNLVCGRSVERTACVWNSLCSPPPGSYALPLLPHYQVSFCVDEMPLATQHAC